MKKFGRWQSEIVAQGYVDAGDFMKHKFARPIKREDPLDSKKAGIEVRSDSTILNDNIFNDAKNTTDCGNSIEKVITISADESNTRQLFGNINVTGGIVNINIHKIDGS